MKAIKRTAAVAVGAAIAGTAAVVGAAPAHADLFGCTVTPIMGTSAFSTCAGEGWHRVHITCWNWWSGSNGGWYERWGNPAWGNQQSISSCDVPFTLRTWDITFN